MSEYKEIAGYGGVIRTSDGATVPPDLRNGDWREYQEWLEAGNTPDPADEVEE